jgi:uncharacterized protein YdeI (YjbR/CyaY-like superfamily)
MNKTITNSRTPHRISKDIKFVLESNNDVLEIWNKLTPLARNEWICWINNVKKEETKVKHLKRFCEDLRGGKRRPCCWPGCPHSNPNTQK